jgi:hypothetical protein
MWLGYIPSDVVDVLAAEIKAKQSKFYTGVPGGIVADLADHVSMLASTCAPSRTMAVPAVLVAALLVATG